MVLLEPQTSVGACQVCGRDVEALQEGFRAGVGFTKAQRSILEGVWQEICTHVSFLYQI